MRFLGKISSALMMCLVLVLTAQRTALTEGKHDQFMPKETYDFLFQTGLQIITGDKNFVGKIRMISNTYNAEPRLKPYSRPRRTEYTTFSFDGYWEKHSTDPIGEHNWSRDAKWYYKQDSIPGRWVFRVRWTTRKEQDLALGQITIIEFEEVFPEVVFMEHGPLERRHDMTITDRFPDHSHKTRAYAKGVWAILEAPIQRPRQ